MAPTEDDARAIADAARAAAVIFAVCHVLRYTPYTRTLKELLDAGRIGRLVSVAAPGAGRLVAPRPLLRARQLAPRGHLRRRCC